jgi:hypothetical protein
MASAFISLSLPNINWGLYVRDKPGMITLSPLEADLNGLRRKGIQS